MNREKIIKMNNMSSEVTTYMKDFQKVYNMSKKELDERSLELLNKKILNSINTVPFYTKKYQDGMIKIPLGNLRELENISFLTKHDLQENYPFGFLAVPLSEVVRYGESTGTSGVVTSSFMTKEDWEENIVSVTYSLLNCYSKDDIVFIMIPYELAFSSFDLEKSFWNIGSTVVAVGAKNEICPINRVAKMMIKIKPSSIVCSPTRAVRLYDKIVEEGYDPKELNLKTIFYLGEICSDAKFKKIKKMWHVEFFSVYGSTETNSLSLPCEYQNQHLTEDRHYFELINPETGERIKDGNIGELVVTSLKHKAFPLIRYRIGDLVEINNEECECGLKFITIKHLGRVGDQFIFKHRKIAKLELEDCILSVEGTGCNLIQYMQDDKLIIKVEVTISSSFEVIDNIKKSVCDNFGIVPEVYLLDKDHYYYMIDKSLKPGSINWSHTISN